MGALVPSLLQKLRHEAGLETLSRKWRLVSDLMRLVYVSSRVTNAEAPVNLILVGPPGDGKTRMVLRGKDLPFVRVYSDISPKGLYKIMDAVRDEYASTMVIPDLGTVIGRKYEIGKQVIANLAMLCAEGVGKVLVMGRERDYQGLKVGLVTAMTDAEYVKDQGILAQNGFLSRLLVVDFTFAAKELRHMQARKLMGDRRLLTPFKYPACRVGFPRRPIRLPAAWAARGHSWWDQAMGNQDATTYGFRTADAINDLLRASAYLHGRPAVTGADAKYVERFKEIWEHPVKAENGSRGQ